MSLSAENAAPSEKARFQKETAHPVEIGDKLSAESREGPHSAANGAAETKNRRSARVWKCSALITAFILVTALVVVTLFRRDNPLADLPSIDLHEAYPEVTDAINAAKGAVLADPDSAVNWGRLAELLMAHEFDAEANVCFKQAARLDPHEVRWLYLWAWSLESVDPQAACSAYGRAIELRPDLPHARLRLAELLMGQNQLDAAIIQLRAVMQIAPDNPRAELLMGRIAWLRGDLRKSLHWTKKSAATAPAKRATHELLAQVYQTLGEREAAEQQRAILEQTPKSSSTWDDPYIQEVANQRRDPHWIVLRAKQLIKAGQFRAGIELLEQVVADHPETWTFHADLARACIAARNYRGAAEVLERGIELHPDSFGLRRLRGVVHYQQREWKQAVQRFQEALELKPDNAPAYVDLGFCLERLDNPVAAIEAYGNAVRFRPDMVDARVSLGRLLLEANQPQEAADHLRIATEIAPNNTTAKRLLERLEQR